MFTEDIENQAPAEPPIDVFQAVELSAKELRLLAKSSHEFFMEYFLAEEIAEHDAIQDFHLLVFSRFVDLLHDRDVIALPRGHAKTTYLRLAFVYLIYFSPLDFFIYLSATHSAAAASLQVVWDYIISVEGQDMFGYPYEILKLAPGEGWYEFKVVAYNEDMEPYNKHVILRGVGQGQALRGMNLRKKRPQFAGVDDVEDDTAVKTEEGYIKLKTWYDNTFMRALDKRKRKVAQIGNLIGKRTLLNDNLNDPDYRSMRLGVLRPNGEPLWPTLWSKEEIEADLRAAIRRGMLGEWMGEMMNIAANLENGLIAPDAITFSKRRHPSDGRTYHSFITIDPAISKEASADECAIVLHTIDAVGIGQHTEYVHRQGMDPLDMADVIEELCLRWGCRTVGVESVQLQKILLSYFELEFKIRAMPYLEFLPIPVGHTHKTARLRTWAAKVRNGDTTLAEDDWDISQQMLQFDTRYTNNSDDLIDACSMYGYMIDNYLDIITKPLASAAQSATGEVILQNTHV